MPEEAAAVTLHISLCLVKASSMLTGTFVLKRLEP